MEKALRLSSLLKLLKSEDSKSIEHVCFWIGELLEEFLPQFVAGQHARVFPSYFSSLADLFTEARIEDFVSPLNWTTVTNRMIYSQYVSAFEDAKVQLHSTIWNRFYSICSNSWIDEPMYLLLHNKLQVKERLFRVGLSDDPYCSSCLVRLGSAVICDTRHFFCVCPGVSAIWSEMERLLQNFLRPIPNGTELLSLNFSGELEKETVWLIKNYVYEIWRVFSSRGSYPSKDQMFGYLRFKFKTEQLGSRARLNIPGL